MDANGDGVIQFNEFITWIEKGPLSFTLLSTPSDHADTGGLPLGGAATPEAAGGSSKASPIKRRSSLSMFFGSLLGGGDDNIAGGTTTPTPAAGTTTDQNTQEGVGGGSYLERVGQFDFHDDESDGMSSNTGVSSSIMTHTSLHSTISGHTTPSMVQTGDPSVIADTDKVETKSTPEKGEKGTKEEKEKKKTKVQKRNTTVYILKPLGITMGENEEDEEQGVHVASCAPGGNADLTGVITAGMILLEACGENVRYMDFDDIMDILRGAPADEELKMIFAPAEGDEWEEVEVESEEDSAEEEENSSSLEAQQYKGRDDNDVKEGDSNSDNYTESKQIEVERRGSGYDKVRLSPGLIDSALVTPCESSSPTLRGQVQETEIEDEGHIDDNSDKEYQHSASASVTASTEKETNMAQQHPEAADTATISTTHTHHTKSRDNSHHSLSHHSVSTFGGTSESHDSAVDDADSGCNWGRIESQDIHNDHDDHEHTDTHTPQSRVDGTSENRIADKGVVALPGHLLSDNNDSDNALPTTFTSLTEGEGGPGKDISVLDNGLIASRPAGPPRRLARTHHTTHTLHRGKTAPMPTTKNVSSIKSTTAAAEQQQNKETNKAHKPSALDEQLAALRKMKQATATSGGDGSAQSSSHERDRGGGSVSDISRHSEITATTTITATGGSILTHHTHHTSERGGSGVRSIGGASVGSGNSSRMGGSIDGSIGGSATSPSSPKLMSRRPKKDRTRRRDERGKDEERGERVVSSSSPHTQIRIVQMYGAHTQTDETVCVDAYAQSDDSSYVSMEYIDTYEKLQQEREKIMYMRERLKEETEERAMMILQQEEESLQSIDNYQKESLAKIKTKEEESINRLQKEEKVLHEKVLEVEQIVITERSEIDRQWSELQVHQKESENDIKLRTTELLQVMHVVRAHSDKLNHDKRNIAKQRLHLDMALHDLQRYCGTDMNTGIGGKTGTPSLYSPFTTKTDSSHAASSHGYGSHGFRRGRSKSRERISVGSWTGGVGRSTTPERGMHISNKVRQQQRDRQWASTSHSAHHIHTRSESRGSSGRGGGRWGSPTYASSNRSGWLNSDKGH